MFQENPGDFFNFSMGMSPEKIQERHREFVDKMCDGFKSSEEINELRDDFFIRTV